MKLRIQDNSLRLRLTRKEVAFLHGDGVVESAIRFANRSLGYSLSSSPDAVAVTVSYTGDSIGVLLPLDVATAWAEGDQVTIEGHDSGVQILVEKDFQCLHQQNGGDADAFPNPLAG